MGKETVTQAQEVQRVPYRINPRRNTPRYTVIKLTKTKHKEKILKATREKQQITYKGIPIRLSADFSTETLQARREWHDIFKVMKEKNLRPRILYPGRLSFRFDREMKNFTDKQKLSKIKYKEKMLKAAREKQQIKYKGIPIRLSADISAETLQARKEWHDTFKEMKGENLQPRILYAARLSFRVD